MEHRDRGSVPILSFYPQQVGDEEHLECAGVPHSYENAHLLGGLLQGPRGGRCPMSEVPLYNRWSLTTHTLVLAGLSARVCRVEGLKGGDALRVCQ